MAVVGEANIIVRAITTGFDNDLRNQLRKIGGAVGPDGRSAGQSIGQAFARGFSSSSGNMFEKVSAGLQQLKPDAEQARLAFRSLVRVSYVVGTGLTALVGGISALVGGLVVLVAAIGKAVPAVAGLASAFIQVRLAAGFAQFALGGVGEAVSAATKQNQGLGKSVAQVTEEFQQLQFQAEGAALSETRAALNLEKALEKLRSSADLPPNSRARREAELAYDEAELAYRKAKDRTQDLNEEVAKGPQALNQGGGDPYAGLTESQKTFAQFLTRLSPKLETLKEAVASGFLPVLQTQIEGLDEKYFPLLESRLTEIGTALGLGAGNIFDNFLDDSTKAEVDQFLTNLRDNIPLIGEIIGEFAELFFRFFNDANGIGTQFLTFVRDTLEGWNTELEKNGLDDFFGDAFATGSRLFGIIGNLFDGFGDFITLLSGEGGPIDTVLKYFEDATGGFASLITDGEVSAEGEALKNTFQGLANNFGPVMKFLGQIIESFLKIGANPAIGEFFTILTDEGNQQNWDNIFKAFGDAAPNLATLITELGTLFAAFADEGAPALFFDTLSQLIGPIGDFFTDNKEFVDLVTRGFAAVTAFTFVFEQIKNFLLVILGNALAVYGVFQGLKFLFVKLIQPAIVAIGTAIRAAFSASPLGFIITAVGILGSALYYFFTQTEEGRKIWEKVVAFMKKAWEGFSELFKVVIDNILSFFNTLGTNLSDAWNQTVEGVKQIWSNVAGWFEDAFENIGNFFEDVWENVTDFFKSVVNGWLGIVENFINFFIDGLNNMISLANSGLGFLGDLIGQELEIGLIGKVTLPRLATGAVVSPSSGGTIAQIAEAGSPERVEPLDDNGLSKRDYAIISALRAGGGGMNITVNPSPGMDERELAEMVSRKIAFEIRRGNI